MFRQLFIKISNASGRMPTVLFVLLFAAITVAANAQTKKLPPFQMVQTSGTLFKAQQLPMGKPILLIYFSPGCDHCEKLVQQLRDNGKALKKLSVVLITYRPVKEVAAFVSRFSLHQFPNFYAGTEGNSFFVRDYYRLEKLPFMALYTKNGDLVQEHRSEKEWDELLKQIKKPGT